MEQVDRTMMVTDDKGNEIKMEILFTTKLEQYNRNYIFYFDPANEDQGVFVSSFEPDTNKLIPVEDENEWNDLNEVLQQFVQEQNENESCSGNCENCESSESCDK